jgi:hypothetical protein
MAIVYTKQARKSSKGTIYAPGKNEETGLYIIFKLCENYDGKVRGGIRKSWCAVAQNLSLEDAKTLFEKRLGEKIYA